MKVVDLKMWRFRCFGSRDQAADEKPDPMPVIVTFDHETTALIGRNGSGKSALLEALQRLFGETREERTVRPSDFFVPPGETLDSAPKRKMFVEVLLTFAELESGITGTLAYFPA